MEEAEIVAAFGPSHGDRTTLSKASRVTIDAIYRHPLAHNLEWSDVLALFDKIGTVDQKGNDEVSFGIAGEHHRIRSPHTKDLTTAEVIAFRHMLTRAGWAPQAKPDLSIKADHAGSVEGAAEPRPDLLLVVDHHEARLYHLDIGSKDLVDHVIKPYDPHHFLHHLTHKDESRERGQRAPEDHAFYEAIAHAIMPGSRIVLVGHGKGHSNAADHLAAFLQKHHHDSFQRVVREVAADLSALTAPQLLDLGRRALTA